MVQIETMQFRRIQDPGSSWDTAIAALPEAGLFHRAGWARVWKSAYRQRSWGILAENDDGAAAGALLLTEKRSRLFGRYLVSMPYFDASGPAAPPDRVPGLIEAAAALARERGLGHVEVRSHAPLPLDAPEASGKVHVRMDLADDPEAMLAGFKKKLRSQVRRGLRETGRVQVGGAELATAFYDIYTERMRDLGSPPHSLAVFEAIAREFPEETRIVVLESEGAPIATGFLLRAGDCAYVPWAATLQAGLPKSLNMALYFELFRTSIEWGAHAFDLGRCDAEGSHLKFKLQWGGEPLPLAWYRIPAHGEIETTPSRDSGMMQRAARMWRRLPLSWTRILGPHVIRHLS